MERQPLDARWPLPPDELGRLEDLRSLDILNTPREYVFDTVVELAARLFDAPCAALSLIDTDRQWFKAEVGIDARERPRENSFCTHAILEHGAMIVADAAEDPRFCQSPLVTCPGGIRFYVGVPLTTYRGHRIGTLCVTDAVPRQADARRLRFLERLGGLIVHVLEERRELAQRAA